MLKHTLFWIMYEGWKRNNQNIAVHGAPKTPDDF
jgi:hypothetical protein